MSAYQNVALVDDKLYNHSQVGPGGTYSPLRANSMLLTAVALVATLNEAFSSSSGQEKTDILPFEFPV